MILFAVTFLVMAGAAIAAGSAKRNRPAEAWLRRLGHTPIMNAPEHVPIAIKGKVARCTAPLSGPLSGQPCVAYELEILCAHHHKTTKVVDARVGVKFLIRDGSGGKALVHLERDDEVNLLLDRSTKLELQGWESRGRLPADLAALLDDARTRALYVDGNPLAFDEHVLLEGTTVVVAGIGQWEADPDPDASTGGLREAARVLVLRGGPRFALIVADDAAAESRYFR